MLETVKGAIGAISLFFCLRLFVLEPCVVEGSSMEPSIPAQGIVLINKLAYGFRLPGSPRYLFQWAQPKQKDILFLKDPFSDTFSVKRYTRTTPYGVFVQGDNHPFSVDSRLYGSVPMEHVWGKVILTIPGRGK